MEALSGKRILVTGASGMAGSAVIRRILAQCPGALIRAVHHEREPLEPAPGVEYVRADLTDRAGCRAVARDCGLAVLTAAKTGGAAAAARSPQAQTTDNVLMDASCLDAVATAGVRRVVYVSSVTVYQDFQGAIAEQDLDLNQDPPAAHFGVGWAKRAAERLCAFWQRTTGMEVAVARASNIFGPFDKFDPDRSNFIPALIRKASDEMDPFEIWGSPDVTRDVIYVDDFADALVRLLLVPGIGFECFNVGSGERTTVGQAARWAMEAQGYVPSEIRSVGGKPASLAFRALDCGKITSLLGWKPEHTIREAIGLTASWWRENRSWWTK